MAWSILWGNSYHGYMFSLAAIVCQSSDVALGIISVLPRGYLEGISPIYAVFLSHLVSRESVV